MYFRPGPLCLGPGGFLRRFWCRPARCRAHNIGMRFRFVVPLGVLWVTTVVMGQPAAPVPNAEEGRRAALKADVAAWDAKNKSLYDTDAAHLVRPGLVADKGDHEVTIKAFATGIGSKEGGGGGGSGGGSGGEAVEFFLIGPASSKGYEALAVSFAKPSDVYAALRFIGLPQGRAVNYSRNRFWPRGERVTMTFHWEETSPDGTASKRSARAEELLLLRSSNAKGGDAAAPAPQTLPPTGLVFVGNESQFVSPLDGGGRGEKQYYGDMGDPGSIASNYNDATTVLDLPVLARQSEVYQSRVINPAYVFKPNQPLEITLKWESPSPPNALRVVDVTLGVSGDADLKSARFTVATDKTLAENTDMAGLFDALTKLVAEKEPFVTVRPGPDLPLSTVKQLYVLLESLQTEKGIRLEPPGEKEAALFHEAFTPNEGLRDYRKRTWQPVEVHFDGLGGAGGKVLLRDFEEKPVAAEGEERAVPKDNSVTSPTDLKKMLADRADQRRPVAVYARAGMKYGELMKWLGPALVEAGGEVVVWVYLE